MQIYIYSLLLVGSLCCSGLCATCAQTFLSSNYITLKKAKVKGYNYKSSSSPSVFTSLRVEVFHFLTWHVVHIRGVVLKEIMLYFCVRQFSCVYICLVLHVGILMHDANYWAKLSHFDAWCTMHSHINAWCTALSRILMPDITEPWMHSIEP